MNLMGLMDVSASALTAERVRAEIVASNMANAETTRTAEGGPYQRRHVIFASESSEAEFQDAFEGYLGRNPGLGFLSDHLSAANPTPGGVSVVGIVTDASAPLRRYDPQHPDAGPDGYVNYPDINPLTEMVDLMGATRSYGMNASAIQAEKNMISSSLEILK
jgi:flagellar basal-body rod protein FlgC